MCLDKALEIVLAGDGRPKRLERLVSQVGFSMENEAALWFAEIQQGLAEYAWAAREIAMHFAGSRRVSWP
jgi:hypothetical protein